jgi:myo-inositol-1(or 4)-monophosphatase
VSEADRACEDAILARLSSAFPGDSFLCEESGFQKRGSLTWAIDPIDGTANFVRGISHWCISIGLVNRSTPVLGLILDPVADELFSAQIGHGAFVNGVPIRVSGQSDLTQARIGIGFSYRRPVAPHARDIQALLDARCEYSRLGSGALGMAYTAAGRLDGYWERHINAWDVVAGLVIAREGGGKTNDFMAGGALLDGNEILAATPELFDQLDGLLHTNERKDES